MVTILFAVVSIVVFRFRSRAALELKLVALQHQLAVLHRQRPGRPQLSSLDRLLWVLLYRIWPQILDAVVMVKPATVVEWHRKGFRFYWHWRSRSPGRPRISPEIRDLVRRMSNANPLWGAPRIHGELLKLGIKISQATVGRWTARAPVAYSSPPPATSLSSRRLAVCTIAMSVEPPRLHASVRNQSNRLTIILSKDRSAGANRPTALR